MSKIATEEASADVESLNGVLRAFMGMILVLGAALLLIIVIFALPLIPWLLVSVQAFSPLFP